MKTLLPNYKTLSIMLFVLFLSKGISGQITINVPTDYPGIRAALTAIAENIGTYPAGSAILIRVHGEGYTVGYDPDGAASQTYIDIADLSTRAYKITIEGDGADKTTIKGYSALEAMPELRFGNNHDKALRFIIVRSGNSLELTFKNLKFQYWGFGNDQGGVIVNLNAASDNGMKVSFINCEFEHLMARAGTILVSNQPNNEIYFDNVFVHNCIIFDNNSFNGFVNATRTKNLTVKNSTFMSNNRYTINLGATNTGGERGVRNGTIFWYRQPNNQDDTKNILFENNVFINNGPVDTPSWATVVAGGFTLNPTPTNIEQPLISIQHEGNAANTTAINVTMRNNIMIENRRSGDNRDVDLLIKNAPTETRIVFTNPGTGNQNKLNAFFQLQNEVYVNANVTGYQVSKDYTYTHQDIDFEMDGTLPRVFYDAFGIGHVKTRGSTTGISELFNPEFKLNVFPNPASQVLQITSDKMIEKIRLVNVLGQVILEQTVNANSSEIIVSSIKEGLYMIQAVTENANVVQKVYIKH
jgi:hypothetical protein